MKILKWDGSRFSEVGKIFSFSGAKVYCMAIDAWGDLYVGGYFALGGIYLVIAGRGEVCLRE